MAFDLIVPPLTPFNDNQKVDYDALKTMVDYVVDDSAATMVMAAGVEAQEYQFLSMEERKELVRKTVEAVDGRTKVAVGITHPSFRTAIELAHFAEDLGADAVQLLAPQKPTGGVPTTRELVSYFEAVGRETRLPIVLYLNAGPGADLTIPQTIELAKLEQVKFIKESSRDLSRVSRLIAEIDLAGHARYLTTMQVLLITLQLGGSGITLPPPASRLARLVVEAYERGDLPAAIELQRQFATFPSRWMQFGLAAVMKATANYIGLPAGQPYPPYEPVSGEALAALHAYLETTELKRLEKTHA